jgi:exodeoxyribonuclease V beta subunit
VSAPATASPPTAEQLEPFDLRGALPTGTTVLEANAGTGKTFTIAALTARYLAEGVLELGDLMLVTFGRNASLELRLRVRERLVGVEAALGLSAAANPGRRSTRSGSCSAPGRRTELAARHARVARALAEFDAATIATTHEFCLQMLDGLGVLGDREPQAVFVEHLGDLVREVTSDVYLRRYAPGGWSPFRSFEEALDVAQRGVGAVHARLAPAAGDPRRRATPSSGWASWPRSALRWSDASSPAGCSPTTTCSPGCGTRSPTRAGERRPPPACGRATGSSWSTSSRTPTPCSGRSCAAPSTATRRWS